MKFTLRFLLVLTIAVVLGTALYYVVQALPGASAAQASPQVQRPPENGTKPPAARERSDNNGRFHFRWRSIVELTRRVILFSVLVFAAVLGKRFLFERTSGRKRRVD